MTNNAPITNDYFRNYRALLGFSNQDNAKSFFGAKDIVPSIDLNYLALLNARLYDLLDKVHAVVADTIKVTDLDGFKAKHIAAAFEIMSSSGILPTLNNQGRRPEQVYYSWMRGYLLTHYFLHALGLIFEVDATQIHIIGDDDLRSSETFKRTPKADVEITLRNSEKVRIEVQTGFTGINDIKQHKVLEAKRVFRDQGIHSIAIHFDLYNGQVAFIRLDTIADDSVHWITRQQMEGQTVFNIDQNSFVWKLTEPPTKFTELNLD